MIDGSREQVHTAVFDGADGSVHVVVSGELDMSTADHIGVTLRRLLDAGAPALVIDLRQLRFIDSSGLRLFVMLAEDAAGRMPVTPVRFVAGSRPVQRVFEITGLHRRLEFVEPHPDSSLHQREPARAREGDRNPSRPTGNTA